MGRAVEAIARKRGHRVIARFDRESDWDALGSMDIAGAVAIDFSQPSTVYKNITRCFQHRIPVVVGTTGWNDSLKEVIETCKKEHQALLTASNFSIGMNIFFAVNTYLASLMNDQESYDVSIEETHHVHKLDKPSGTAISLSQQIIEQIRRKKEWTMDEALRDPQLSIQSIREGEVFGDHQVTYDSDADRITISHSAKNRKGFALGAVMAAEWLQDKKGYYEMRDFLGL